jgi:hypothetical protein
MPKYPTLLRALLFAPLLLLLLLACNLTNVPRTPTPQPTAVPLILPTTPPIIAPGTIITPVGGGVSPSSTCPFTPTTWIAYTVQPGDSIGALSIAVDTPMQDLVTNNCLQDANSLFADQVIYLPRLP